MRIIVMKFGGTSVANLECMKRVRAKVRKALYQGYKVVAVLSAMSGETNRLLALAEEWSETPDTAELDSLVSTGEQVSTALFSMLLKDADINARSLLGFQARICTDCDYTRARITGIDSETVLKMFEEHDVLVMAGFQGCDDNGRITTLGRGGSDTSAVAMAAALNAEECEIYTDVEGVFTTDPRICSEARKLEKISYDEMLEMASMGSKVLQIRSVEFAKKYNVKVHVRSTFTDTPGTIVTQEDESMESVLVSGISFDRDQARITIEDVKDRPGIAATIFKPLADAGILVDMIIQNASRDGHTTDMTFTVTRKDLEKTREILESLEDMNGSIIKHDLNVCKVSVIGNGMRSHSGVASAAFAALSRENVNILMISTSEIKITCLIEDKYTELAVRTLHDEFNLHELQHQSD